MRETTLYWAHLGAMGNLFDAIKPMTGTLTATGFPTHIKEEKHALHIHSSLLGQCTIYADELYGRLRVTNEDALRSILILGIAGKQTSMLLNTSNGRPCSRDEKTNFLRAHYPDMDEQTLLRLMAVCGLICPDLTAWGDNIISTSGDAAVKVCF